MWCHTHFFWKLPRPKRQPGLFLRPCLGMRLSSLGSESSWTLNSSVPNVFNTGFVQPVLRFLLWLYWLCSHIAVGYFCSNQKIHAGEHGFLRPNLCPFVEMEVACLPWYFPIPSKNVVDIPLWTCAGVENWPILLTHFTSKWCLAPPELPLSYLIRSCQLEPRRKTIPTSNFDEIISMGVNWTQNLNNRFTCV